MLEYFFKAGNYIKISDFNTGVFLRILQYFKNNFFYRTPPVAASVGLFMIIHCKTKIKLSVKDSFSRYTELCREL